MPHAPGAIAEYYYAATCADATPCPHDMNYFHCMEGTAAGGCRPAGDGPFPAPDCTSQCSVEEIVVPTCDFETECPAGTYWHCTAGDAINGCSLEPFAYGPCTAMCMSVKA